MAMTTKVPLYIANDLQELNSRAEENPSLDKAKQCTCTQIGSVIDATCLEANKSENNRDEERAYILYMRSLACFECMRKAKDVGQQQVRVEHDDVASRTMSSYCFQGHVEILSQTSVALAGKSRSIVSKSQSQVGRHEWTDDIESRTWPSCEQVR
jgi:hypothetical protein